QEYVDKRKNIIKNNFLNRIELLHYRLPKNIIDRMQTIAQALGFTLPKVDIATDNYITHKKQDSILASIQEDFETFKDTVRERLSILKGNDLTPEQKKKALAL